MTKESTNSEANPLLNDEGSLPSSFEHDKDDNLRSSQSLLYYNEKKKELSLDKSNEIDSLM